MNIVKFNIFSFHTFPRASLTFLEFVYFMSAFVAYNDPHDQTSDESGRYYPKQRFPFRLYLHSMFSDLNLKV